MKTIAKDAEQLQNKSPPAPPSMNSVFVARCRCGNANDKINMCHFNTVTCRNCGKLDPIQKVCCSKPKASKSVKRKNPKKAKQRIACYCMMTIVSLILMCRNSVVLSYVPYRTQKQRDLSHTRGKPLKMDTGSAVSSARRFSLRIN